MHRFEQAEERTHELEDMSIEIIQSEEQKEKQWGKKKTELQGPLRYCQEY